MIVQNNELFCYTKQELENVPNMKNTEHIEKIVVACPIYDSTMPIIIRAIDSLPELVIVQLSAMNLSTDVIVDICSLSDESLQLLMDTLKYRPHVSQFFLKSVEVSENIYTMALNTYLVNVVSNLYPHHNLTPLRWREYPIGPKCPILKDKTNDRLTMNGQLSQFTPELHHGHSVVCVTLQELTNLPKCDDLDYVSNLEIYCYYSWMDEVRKCIEALPNLTYLTIITGTITIDQWQPIADILLYRPYLKHLTISTIENVTEFLHSINDTYVSYVYVNNNQIPLPEYSKRSLRIKSKTKSAMKR